MFKKIFVLVSLVIFNHMNLVNSNNMNSCDDQSNCIDVVNHECDENGYRRVCLQFKRENLCRLTGTISFISNRYESIPNLDVDSQMFCDTVKSGENAVFGIKDEYGCSGSGSYKISGLNDGKDAYCIGPVNVFNEEGECRWTIPTEKCDNHENICPSEVNCKIQIPINKKLDSKNVDCKCTHYSLSTSLI